MMNSAETVLKDGLEADVVVIAAGAAGLAAMVEAAERGAKVIAFEKSDKTGGTAKRGAGLFAVESRLQLINQTTLSREETFRIFMDWSHWRVNARLVRAFVNKSASTIDWLEGMGVEFLYDTHHGMRNYATQHTVKGPGKGPGHSTGPADTMTKILTEKARQLGVKIFLKTGVTKILKEGDRTTGVLVKDSSGKEFQVKSRAVIIATGGYSEGVPAMPEITGDGIRMAREAGADASEIPSGSRVSDLPPQQAAHRLSRVLETAFDQPNLMVNLLGERFVTEEPFINSLFKNNAVGSQKNGTAFTIFDENTKRHYVEEGFDFIAHTPREPITRATNFDEELKQALAAGDLDIFVADSLQELASQTGIDLEGLQETVDEFNQACDTGRDEIFDRKARYLRPVRQPKFYAVKNIADASEQQYGIRINHKTEVMTQDYTVIPGLYAVGTDTISNIYHGTYPMIMVATAMGFAINSGRIAGENAVKYLAATGQ